MLDHGDPAAFDIAIVELAIADVFEVDLQVTVFWRGKGGPQEGAHAHLRTARGIAAVVAHQLADETRGYRCLAGIVQQVGDIHGVTVAIEGEALDDIHAIDGGAEIHLYLIVPFGQPVFGLLGGEGDAP